MHAICPAHVTVSRCMILIAIRDKHPQTRYTQYVPSKSWYQHNRMQGITAHKTTICIFTADKHHIQGIYFIFFIRLTVYRTTQAGAPISYFLPPRKPNARLSDCLFTTINSNVVNEGSSSLRLAVVYTQRTNHTSRVLGFSVSRVLDTVTMKSVKDGASIYTNISDHECALTIPMSWVTKFLRTYKLGYLWKSPVNGKAQNRPFTCQK